MIFAVIDLGSNSFRLQVADVEGDKLSILKSVRDPIRLGAGLDAQGNLTPAAQEAALNSLAGFRKVLSNYRLEGVRVVATNTFRVASNTAYFMEAAEKAVGYPIEVISGEEEGRLIYMGVCSALNRPDERRLVVDIGGGSTELVVGMGSQIESVESFSIGSVRQVHAFFPNGRVDAASLQAAVLSARAQFEDGVAAFHPQHWSVAYGSSGTMRAISEAIASNEMGNGDLDYANLEALAAYLIDVGDLNKVDLHGIKPERVYAMAGGLTILMGLMQEIGFDKMKAVDAGLRLGVLRDLQLRASRQDRRESSVQELMRRFHVDQWRANRAAEIALFLHDQLQLSSEGYSKYLRWSALLHEIGQVVSHTGYHKHGAYLVEHADIPGFTGREQDLMSKLVLAQKGNLRKMGSALDQIDLAKATLALRLAVLFMHARGGVDLSRMRLKMKNKIEIEFNKSDALEHPSINYWLEKEARFWEEVDVPFSIRTR
jgi:exopolyphosphatase/guanosine-5'-triphosphate,3'-diphosphate pyrophosphatase